MTEETKKLFDNYFSRYGNPSTEMQRQFYLNFTRPDAIDDLKRVVSEDKYAARRIQEMQELIDFLKVYRVELADRYNHLLTDPYVIVIKLRREVNWSDNKKYYWIEWFKRYTDTGKEVRTDFTKYDGKQRHQAIKDFDDYVKTHPGIVSEKNIEKGRY